MTVRRTNTSSIILWAIFFGFSAIAIGLNWDPDLLDPRGTNGTVRLVLIAAWVAFTAYSIHCSRHENLFRTVGAMSKLYWGRQIGIDLYISVGLSIAFVYLVTGSIVTTLFWSLAFIPFANQAILLFVILYLDDILAMAPGLN